MKRLLIILTLGVVAACSPPKETVTTVSIDDPESQAVLLIDIWALEKIGEQAVTAADFSTEIPSIDFQSDKKMTGRSGCNQISGTYFLDGERISFGPLMSTKMACPGDGEKRFLDALNSADAFKIRDLKLYLFKGNIEVLRFKKVD